MSFVSEPDALPISVLDPRLIEFNLLPSRTLHPERLTQLLPDVSNAAKALMKGNASIGRALHQRWSTRLLRTLGEAASPVLETSLPALRLALLPPEGMRRLARTLGIVLLGRHLRHLIARDDVLAARQALGDKGMSLAYTEAKQLYPGIEQISHWLADGLAGSADVLGNALLALSWQEAPLPLRLRADWKLPLSADSAEAQGASGLSSQEARSLSLELLARMDPSWISSFPTTR